MLSQVRSRSKCVRMRRNGDVNRATCRDRSLDETRHLDVLDAVALMGRRGQASLRGADGLLHRATRPSSTRRSGSAHGVAGDLMSYTFKRS